MSILTNNGIISNKMNPILFGLISIILVNIGLDSFKLFDDAFALQSNVSSCNRCAPISCQVDLCSQHNLDTSSSLYQIYASNNQLGHTLNSFLNSTKALIASIIITAIAIGTAFVLLIRLHSIRERKIEAINDLVNYIGRSINNLSLYSKYRKEEILKILDEITEEGLRLIRKYDATSTKLVDDIVRSSSFRDLTTKESTKESQEPIKNIWSSQETQFPNQQAIDSRSFAIIEIPKNDVFLGIKVSEYHPDVTTVVIQIDKVNAHILTINKNPQEYSLTIKILPEDLSKPIELVVGIPEKLLDNIDIVNINRDNPEKIPLIIKVDDKFLQDLPGSQYIEVIGSFNSKYQTEVRILKMHFTAKKYASIIEISGNKSEFADGSILPLP